MIVSFTWHRGLATIHRAIFTLLSSEASLRGGRWNDGLPNCRRGAGVTSQRLGRFVS